MCVFRVVLPVRVSATTRARVSSSLRARGATRSRSGWRRASHASHAGSRRRGRRLGCFSLSSRQLDMSELAQSNRIEPATSAIERTAVSTGKWGKLQSCTELYRAGKSWGNSRSLENRPPRRDSGSLLKTHLVQRVAPVTLASEGKGDSSAHNSGASFVERARTIDRNALER